MLYQKRKSHFTVSTALPLVTRVSIATIPLLCGCVLNVAMLSAQASEYDASANLQPNLQPNLQQVNQQFSAAVVISTYQRLVEKTSHLVQASRVFERSPGEETLADLRMAWLEARLAWAKGNAFEFGPVHSLGYGMAIDAPVDTTAVDWVWSQLAADDLADVNDVVAQPLRPALGGLGVIAHILGDAGLPDSAALDAVSRETALLDSLRMDSLRMDGAQASDAQTSDAQTYGSLGQRRYISELASGVHVAASDLLSVWQVGWNGYPAYSTVLASAGSADNVAYLSVQSGTEEIIRGLINSLDVVVNESLPVLLETSEMSEASGASMSTVSAVDLQLIEATLKGIRLAYQSYQMDSPVRLRELQTRGLYTARSTGLAAVVASVNNAQNQQLQRSLEQAIEQVIVARVRLDNPDAVTLSLSMAIESLMVVQTLLAEDILPMAQR